eukprot:1966706-Pleurochrysis_carterae.AAC.2
MRRLQCRVSSGPAGLPLRTRQSLLLVRREHAIQTGTKVSGHIVGGGCHDAPGGMGVRRDETLQGAPRGLYIGSHSTNSLTVGGFIACGSARR